MKLIIDIHEEQYKFIKQGMVMAMDNVIRFPALMESIYECIANGTPIPDNATNGDIIKTLYSRTRDFATGLEHLGVEVRIGEFPSKLTMNVDSDWWNAPYQKK